VSDNCVVLPGNSIGKNAVLGSNSVCPEGWYLPEESPLFGSKGNQPTCLKGVVDEVECFTDGPMLSCRSKDKIQMDGVTNCVWPLSRIISATVMIKTFIVVFHTLPLLGALYGAAGQLCGWALTERDFTIKHKFYEMQVVTCLCSNLCISGAQRNLSHLSFLYLSSFTVAWSLWKCSS
jgi:hypothetical protein